MAMIAVITKMHYYWGLLLWSQSSQNDHNPISEDCDHHRSLHKNIMFLNFYKSATIITILFIRTVIMITVFIKMVLYLNLCEDCHGRNPHALFLSFFECEWSHSSLLNAIFLSQSSQRTAIMSHNAHINITIISRPTFTDIEWSLMLSRFKHK